MEQQRLRQFGTVYLATDHAGFVLKEEVKKWLEEENFLVIDGGADAF
jgi:ribose 5-phosphate isomerase RpiB